MHAHVCEHARVCQCGRRVGTGASVRAGKHECESKWVHVCTSMSSCEQVCAEGHLSWGRQVPPTAWWLVQGPEVAEAPAECARGAPMSSGGKSPTVIQHLPLTAAFQ